MKDKYGNGKLGLYDPGLHLFVDDREVRFMQQVNRKWPAPHIHDGPVLAADYPFEITAGGGTVIYDESVNKFRCWYMTMGQPPHDQFVISYAESNDGIRWMKPNLGLFEWQGRKENNVVMTHHSMAPLSSLIGGYTIKDDNDPDPQRRYKMFCYMQDDRMFKQPEFWATDHYYYSSADGIRFSPKATNTHVGSTSDRYSFAYDQKRKVWIGGVGIPSQNGWMRLSGFKESADIKNWSDAIQPFIMNEHEEAWGTIWDHHTLFPFLYGGQYLGYFERHRKPSFLIDVELISSRDAKHWERPTPRGTRFVHEGSDGDWNEGVAFMCYCPPIPVGDELYIYFRGGRHRWPGKPVGGTGLARIRRDGFCGLMNNNKEAERIGSVLTEPVEVVGPNLYLNAISLPSGGEFTVELRDKNFVHIKGYEMENCIVLKEGGIRAKVTWKDRPDVSDLVGKRVMVHIRFRWGTLYAYKFGD